MVASEGFKGTGLGRVALVDEGRVFVGVDEAGRDYGEDAVGIFPVPGGELWVVADGMGGEEKGEVASKEAIDTAEMMAYNRQNALASASEVRAFMSSVFVETQRALADNRTLRKGSRAGTTMTMLLAKAHAAYLAHMGDSRGRIFGPDNGLIHASVDHSVLSARIASILSADISPEHKAARIAVYAHHEDNEEMTQVIQEIIETAGASALAILSELIDMDARVKTRNIITRCMGPNRRDDFTFTAVEGLPAGWWGVLASDGVKVSTHEIQGLGPKNPVDDLPRVWRKAGGRAKAIKPMSFRDGREHSPAEPSLDNTGLLVGRPPADETQEETVGGLSLHTEEVSPQYHEKPKPNTAAYLSGLDVEGAQRGKIMPNETVDLTEIARSMPEGQWLSLATGWGRKVRFTSANTFDGGQWADTRKFDAEVGMLLIPTEFIGSDTPRFMHSLSRWTQNSSHLNSKRLGNGDIWIRSAGNESGCVVDGELDGSPIETSSLHAHVHVEHDEHGRISQLTLTNQSSREMNWWIASGEGTPQAYYKDQNLLPRGD